MKKGTVAVLILIALVLVLAIGAMAGFLWYRNTHFFVEDTAYSVKAEILDLRGQEISLEHYDAVRARLPDCRILWDVPFQGGRVASDARQITVTTLTNGDAELLAAYLPELEQVDAAACGDYAVLELLKALMPETRVQYTVDLGGVSAEPDVTALELNPGEYTYDALNTNLVYLPELEQVLLRTPELSQEQIAALKEAHPGVRFGCTVEILGREYDDTVTELDLSAMTSADVEQVVLALERLPALARVDLTGTQEASSLSIEEVKRIQEAAPEAVLRYVFEFYGYTISTDDQQVHIRNKNIGDDNIDQVRAVLDIMTGCERFVLEYCRIDYDLLAQLREEYRDKTKLVWRVEFGEGSCMTDVEVIRCTYDLVDDNCHNLIYCEDVRFMDIGHNEWLDAVPFAAGMPNLEGIIVSGAPIKDLTPFENCKNLKFLEIAFCEYITDLSPLAGCESLQMLNIGNTHAEDLSPLDQLPLTCLMARVYPSGRCRIPAEEQERFRTVHPDAYAGFTGTNPYIEGWRYDEEGEYLPYYAMLRRIFRYDDDNIPNNVGWYLEEGITDLSQYSN